MHDAGAQGSDEAQRVPDGDGELARPHIPDAKHGRRRREQSGLQEREVADGIKPENLSRVAGTIPGTNGRPVPAGHVGIGDHPVRTQDDTRAA